MAIPYHLRSRRQCAQCGGGSGKERTRVVACKSDLNRRDVFRSLVQSAVHIRGVTIPSLNPNQESDFQPLGESGSGFGSGEKLRRNTSSSYSVAGSEGAEAPLCVRGVRFACPIANLLNQHA